MSIMPMLRSFINTIHEDTPELYQDFLKDIQSKGMTSACKIWAKKWNKSHDTFTRQMYAHLDNPNYFWFAVDVYGKEEAERKQVIKYDEKPVTTKAVVKNNQIKLQKTAEPQLPAPIEKQPGELTAEETTLLEKFKSGEVGFDHMQHEMAYRLFKKILENPQLIKVSDWLKSEVIKIQREEISLKKEQMERSWALLFGSFEFPKHCPHCGFDLQPKAIGSIDPNLEAEIVKGDDDSESVGTTTGI